MTDTEGPRPPTPLWAAALRDNHPSAQTFPVDVVKPSLLDAEPVALAGALQGLLIAVLAVLQGFNVTHLSQDQVSLLLALYVALVAAATAFAKAKAPTAASVERLNAKRVARLNNSRKNSGGQ